MSGPSIPNPELLTRGTMNNLATLLRKGWDLKLRHHKREENGTQFSATFSLIGDLFISHRGYGKTICSAIKDGITEVKKKKVESLR